MNNTQKQAFEKLDANIECWGAVPVIINGCASYNFYHAQNNCKQR